LGAAVQSLFDEQGEVTQNGLQTGGSACKAGVTQSGSANARSFKVLFILYLLLLLGAMYSVFASRPGRR